MTAVAHRSDIRLLLWTLLAGLACLGSGCGSSKAGSKAAFVSRANSICAAADKDLSAISGQLRGLGQTTHSKRDLYARAATLTHQAAVRQALSADQLAALTPPGADRSSIETWIGQLRRQSALTEVAVAAFTARNPKGASQAVSQILPVESQAHAFANRYGMQACGKTAGA